MACEFSIRVYPSVAAYLSQVADLAGMDLLSDPGYFYFHYPVWTQTIWDFWEGKRQSRPLFLVAFRQEEIVGWWPLVLSRRTLGYRLQNLGQELSDYALPFVKTAWQEQRAALTAAFLQTALAQAKNFAFAQFAGFLYPPDPFQPHSAGELQHWLTTSLPGSWEIGPPVDNRTLKLSQTPADPEAFLAQHFSRKFQKNLKMDEKKLLKAGPLALKQLKGFAELAPLQSQYFAWYRYQDRDAGQRQRKLTAWWEFFRAAPSEHLAANVMTLAGEPVSIIIGFWRGGQFDYFSPVFNPQYRSLSPGKIHLLHLLLELRRQGCPRFNFLVGGEEYKHHWTKENYFCWRLRFYHPWRPVSLFYWLRHRWRRRNLPRATC